MADTIKIEILEDGTVRFETDKISGANHASADEFLAEVEILLGGKITIEHKKDRHVYVHEDGTVHAH
jgi:hypothetical protein